MLCLFFKHQTLFTHFEASGISAEFWGEGTGQFPGASHDSLLQRRLGLGGWRVWGGGPALRPSVPRGGRPGGQWRRRTGPRRAGTPRAGSRRPGWPWWWGSAPWPSLSGECPVLLIQINGVSLPRPTCLTCSFRRACAWTLCVALGGPGPGTAVTVSGQHSTHAWQDLSFHFSFWWPWFRALTFSAEKGF